jgi:IS4 transposase
VRPFGRDDAPMNQGRNVFAQLVELLPRRAFENAVSRYGGDRRVRSLSCMDQLLTMIFAQLTARSSLRETVSCLSALGSRLYHCGIRGPVARSTLARANENRDYRIFMDTAMAMIAAARIDLPVDKELTALNAEVYALDSTTIDLCLKLFPWASFRRRKAGIKAHTMLDLRVGIPVFLWVTHAKTHDLWALDQITFVAGAFYVMDKAYVDFARLHRVHCAGAFFITRAKRNMDFGVRQRLPTDIAVGVQKDRLIRLRGPKSRQLYPDTLRLIRYVDPKTGKRLTFLTNNLTLEAQTVALLYHKRWEIELFFKWIKQHLHIKTFFGTTPNAVKTQLWAAVITHVLTVKLRHRYQLPQAANEIFQILGVTLLEKMPVFELFSQEIRRGDEVENHKQLSLFE